MLSRLKLLRKEEGISQQKLADAVSVSQQSINKYENHDVEPDFDTLKKLAAFFDVSIDYLIENTDIKQKPDGIRSDDLTQGELRLVHQYRSLNRSQRESILAIIENYLEK